MPSCHHLCVSTVQVIFLLTYLLFSLCSALMPVVANSQGNIPAVIDHLYGDSGAFPFILSLHFCSPPVLRLWDHPGEGGEHLLSVAVALCKYPRCCLRGIRTMLSCWKSVQLHCQDSANLNQLNVWSLFRYYSLPAVVEFGYFFLL